MNGQNKLERLHNTWPERLASINTLIGPIPEL
jgi:hypothetical protein